MTAFRGILEKVNVIADGLGGVAAVTYTIRLAWRLDVESSGIDG